MRHLALGILVVTSACRSTNATETSTLESASKNGHEYSCQRRSGEILEPKISILVNGDQMIITDGPAGSSDNQMSSDRDTKYRPRSNPNAVRFKSFREFGGDCELAVVVDSKMLTGTKDQSVSVICTAEGMPVFSNYHCAESKPVNIAKPRDSEPAPIAPASNFSCKGGSKEHVFGVTSFELGLSDKFVGVSYEDEGTSSTVVGARDEKYKPRSDANKNMLKFGKFDFGGDCQLGMLVDKSALIRSTKTFKMNLQCAGEVFEQSTAVCTRKN